MHKNQRNNVCKSETKFTRGKWGWILFHPYSFNACIPWLCPRAKRLTGFSSASVFVRWPAACLKITVTKKNDGGSLRLNRHVPPWSNVSFFAKHTEMIKIFPSAQNHRGIDYLLSMTTCNGIGHRPLYDIHIGRR